MKPSVKDRRERRPLFERIGTYLPLLMLLGFAVPTLVYLVLMVTLGWRAPILGAQAALPAVTLGKVILYAAPATKGYLAGIGGNYETLLVPWRTYFKARNIDYKEIQDSTELRKASPSVLIMPSALALSDQERDDILAFQAKGGGILSTWASGTRKGNGDWAGWDFLAKLGATVSGEMAPGPEVGYLITLGASPVSHQHSAGQRIGLGKTSESLLRLKGDMVAARFMNWARIGDEGRRGEGAVIYWEPDAPAGRVASFAFAESVWESRPLLMYPLIDDTLQWLKREPVVVLAAWPNGKRAAQIVEMDTEEGFANAWSFADMMRALDLPATFYVLTSVGQRFPNVLTKLAIEFEIAYHGDLHDDFKGQSAVTQEERIRTMRTEMASVLPDIKNITGFRAPSEGYDAATEKLLQKYGVRHHAADPSRTEARLPVLAKMDGVVNADTLVILPRTQRDDVNLAKENLTAEQTTQALIADFEQTVETGALGLFSLHSQNFGADSTLVKAMPAYLLHIKQRSGAVWLASAGQVADWWRVRDDVKLSSIIRGKRLDINITVTGKKPIKGATLVLMLPHKGVPKVQATTVGQKIPTVSRIDDYRTAITFDFLAPGNHEYQATFGQ